MTTNKNTNTQNNNNNQRVIVNINTSSLHEHHKRKPISKPKEKQGGGGGGGEPVQQQVSNHNIYYPEQSLITNTPHTPIPPYMQTAVTNRDMAMTSLKNSMMTQTEHQAMRDAFTTMSVPGGVPLPEASTPSSIHTNPLFEEDEEHTTSPKAESSTITQHQETPKSSPDYHNPLFEIDEELSPTHSENSAQPYLPFLPENSPLVEHMKKLTVSNKASLL